MKKIFTVFVILSLMISTSCADMRLKILDNVELGMSPSEVERAVKNSDYYGFNDWGCTVSEFHDQLYTNVWFDFANSETETYHFDQYTDDKDILASYMAFEIMLDPELKALNSMSSKSDIEEYFLIQIYAQFTSDHYYRTAIETFDLVEDYLNKTVGHTRFTARRGESLKPYKNWYTAGSTFSIFPTAGLEILNLSITVPQYTHRVVKLETGKYAIIDHRIVVQGSKDKSEDGTFKHEIVYTLCPWDISDGYALE